MKSYKVRFSIKADGENLLWTINNDTAIIHAETQEQARNKLKEHCTLWGYNSPIISEIIEL